MKLLKIFALCLSSAALFSSTVLADELSACQCYETKALNITDFLIKNKIVESKKTSCKSGYFMTGIAQKPEINPLIHGQYVFVKSISCCRLCSK